jgi:multidrug efflux pump subunit AcrB
MGDESIILEPTGNYNNIDDIRQTLIPVGNQSQLISLEDITTISKGYINPAKQLVRVNGLNALSLHVNLKDGANVIALGEDIDVVMEEWNSKLPIGLELIRLSSLDTYIDVKISDFIGNLGQSIIIVLAVMLIFLGFRTGTIIASLIPIVTIMTLMWMGVINMGLNQVTLAALIMALGMMVDNAIVVAESVMVKVEGGMDTKQAAIESCSELFAPLLISTLTTSAAFMAFYLAESVMGDIVGPIFVVITIALLSSWLIALTVVTLFCYYFLKVNNSGELKESVIDRLINWMKALYKDWILNALQNKYLVIVGILVMFMASLFGFTRIAFLFFPDSDRNLITVDINLPEGTRIETNQETVRRLEDYFGEELLVSDENPTGIISWSSYIGEGPESYDLGYQPDEANSNYAHILVNTSDASLNNSLITTIDNFVLRNFPNADIKVGPLGAGGGGVPIEIRIIGDEPDQLSAISEAVKIQLSSIAGTKNVKDNWGPKSKKFVIQIDENRAQNAGITNQDIATSLQTVLTGFRTGEYREDDKSIPILMKSDVGSEQSY